MDGDDAGGDDVRDLDYQSFRSRQATRLQQDHSSARQTMQPQHDGGCLSKKKNVFVR